MLVAADDVAGFGCEREIWPYNLLPLPRLTSQLAGKGCTGVPDRIRGSACVGGTKSVVSIADRPQDGVIEITTYRLSPEGKGVEITEVTGQYRDGESLVAHGKWCQAGQPPGWSCFSKAERSGWVGFERTKTIWPFMAATNLSAELSRKNRRSRLPE